MPPLNSPFPLFPKETVYAYVCVYTCIYMHMYINVYFFFFSQQGSRGLLVIYPDRRVLLRLACALGSLGDLGWRRVEPGPGPRSVWRGPCLPWFSPSHKSLPRSGSRRGPRGQARTSDGGRGLGLRRVLQFSSQHIQPGRWGTATCKGPLGPLAHLGPPDLRQGPGRLSPDPAPRLGGLPSPRVSPMDAAQRLRCSASPDTSKTFPTLGWGIL